MYGNNLAVLYGDEVNAVLVQLNTVAGAGVRVSASGLRSDVSEYLPLF